MIFLLIKVQLLVFQKLGSIDAKLALNYKIFIRISLVTFLGHKVYLDAVKLPF